jgi:hypothetical protein
LGACMWLVCVPTPPPLPSTASNRSRDHPPSPPAPTNEIAPSTRPPNQKVCSEERAVYCKDVRPGKARVVKCLMEHMAQPNFGADCRGELRERSEAVKSDYRYDAGVLENCKEEVDGMCAEAKTKLRGSAAVLKCLVQGFEQASGTCQVGALLWRAGCGVECPALAGRGSSCRGTELGLPRQAIPKRLKV